MLAAAFLSQQPYFKGSDESVFSYNSIPGQSYLAKGANWLKDSLYPRISGEVQKRGDLIKNEINQEKEKISESVGEKIKNYFSGVVDSVFNPGEEKETQNCSQTCPQVQPGSQPYAN